MTTTRPTSRFRLAAISVAAFSVLICRSPALQLIQYDVDAAYSPSHMVVLIDVRNTDSLGTYYSCELHILSTLADAVWALPHVQAAFSSKSAMWSQWGMAMLTYEVDYGWTADTGGPDDAVSFTHRPGNPQFDFDIWFNSSILETQDEVRYRVVIPKSHLDHDGDGWSATDPGDYLLEVDLGRPVSVAATADSSEAGDPNNVSFSGVGFGYRASAIGTPLPAAPLVELVFAPGQGLSLLLSGLTVDATYTVERSTEPEADVWNGIDTFTATAGTMQVPLPSEGGGEAVLYRVSAAAN